MKDTGEQIVMGDKTKLIISNHIGLKFTYNQIKERWAKLIQNGFLLENIAGKLIDSDDSLFAKFPEYYIGIPIDHPGGRIVPAWHQLVRLVDLCLQIENCKDYNKIIGFEQRIKDTKEDLNSKLDGDPRKIYEKIISANSELIFVSNLCSSKYSKWNRLELCKEKTPNRKSDFKIDLPIGIKKVEMKTIIEDFIVPNIPYKVEERSIGGSLLRYSLDPSVDAFNNQEADIAFINLTHCYCGLLFRNVNDKNKNMSFEYALNKAIDLVKNGKKAIVLFAEFYAPHRLVAQTLDEEFLKTGREFLDKIRVKLRKKWWGIDPTPDEMMKIIDAITKLYPHINEEKIISTISELDSKPHEIDKIVDAIKSMAKLEEEP